MKRPAFMEGVGLALGVSFFASVLFAVLGPVFGGAAVLRLLIAASSLVYVIYLLARSRERVGRVTTLAAWAVVALALWWLEPLLLLYVLAHAGFIWLIRSLYFHSGVISALADLGLTGLGLVAAVWATLQAGSLFLSLWCFFLVQALFVAIPARLGHKPSSGRTEDDTRDRFQHAYRAAEGALRKLTSVN
ncbi:MAG: hypothetical protein HKM88_03625 [Halobacteria archaeon]|nr:hypothetical protein [Halobacteria archaeon]